MPLELWIAFVVTSAALLTVPGPTVLLVASYALGQGRATAWATVPGVTLGDFVAMTVSLLGAGAVLAASATLFTVLKAVGAVYLIWLGIRLWRASAPTGGVAAAAKAGTRSRMFWSSFLVTALNPKGIVFFVAFVPQFVDPALPVWPQFLILEATFLGLAAMNAVLWAVLAGHLRSRLVRPAAMLWANRLGACFLVGAGVLTAAVRRGN